MSKPDIGANPMRAAIYARYSTDLQREASIEDQVRICRQRIEQEGWQLIATYPDAAASGESRLRLGYQTSWWPNLSTASPATRKMSRRFTSTCPSRACGF